MAPFHYHLNSREIRLIRLTHDHGTSIQCEISTFSLDKDITYVALSYLWTEPGATCTIHINGTKFDVRPNLFAYLELLRDEGNEEWTFINALCISQDDTDEKERQIPLMSEIYRRAQDVISCLGTFGPCDENLEAILHRACSNIDEVETLFDDASNNDQSLHDASTA